jgi:hypothetical protein
LESSTVYQSRQNQEDRGKLPHQTLVERKAKSVKQKNFYRYPFPSHQFLDLPTALLYNLQHADCLNLHCSVTEQTELENRKRLLWLGRDTRHFFPCKTKTGLLFNRSSDTNAEVFHQIMKDTTTLFIFFQFSLLETTTII